MTRPGDLAGRVTSHKPVYVNFRLAPGGPGASPAYLLPAPSPLLSCCIFGGRCMDPSVIIGTLALLGLLLVVLACVW
jgi:hypothetical protein